MDRRRRATLAAACLALALAPASGCGDDSKPRHASGSTKGAQAGAGTPQRSHRGWRPHTGPVSILMYHAIANGGPGISALFVAPRDFKAQMAWLKRNGYDAVTLADVERAWRHGGTLPRKPVVISFDDGYDNQYTRAAPVLARYGWPGVLYLQASALKHVGGLTRARVRSLIARGWELGAHTMTHPDLTTLDAAGLRYEVIGSRRFLRRVFGAPVEAFCYPAGRFVARVVAAVRKAGFRSATTVAPGLASREHPFQLDRLRVARGDGLGGFVEQLRAAGG